MHKIKLSSVNQKLHRFNYSELEEVRGLIVDHGAWKYDLKLDFDMKPFVKQKDVTKIYLSKDCVLPRKYLRSDGSFAIVRDFNRADAVFLSENFIKSHCRHNSSYISKCKDLRKAYDVFTKSTLSTNRDHTAFIKLISLITNLEEDDLVVYDDWTTRNHVDNVVKNGSNHSYYFYISSDRTPILDFVFDPANQDKIHSVKDLGESLLRTSNMSADEFESMRQLFLSKDTENTELAVNLMVNYNFKDSIVYLLSLLAEFSGEIACTKMSNSVVFKNMLNFYKLARGYYLDTDRIIYKLKEIGLFNEKNAGMMHPIYMKKMTEYYPLVNIKEFEFVGVKKELTPAQVIKNENKKKYKYLMFSL